MTRLLVPLVFSLATAASALTFTTHFPLTRGTPSYAVSPASAAIVYAVNRGTLYRSNDGGITFETRSNIGGASVVVDPTNAEIVYDATSGLRSEDGGATWRRFGGNTAFGVRLTIHPANPSEIHLFGFCSSFHPMNAGEFVSYDRGEHWQQETSACTFDVTIDPLPPHTVYRAHLSGSTTLPTRQIVGNARTRYGLNTYDNRVILVSADGGITWEARPQNERVWQLALDGDRLFAARESGLYASTDGAQTWLPIVAGPAWGVTIAGERLYVASPRGWAYAPLATLAPFTPVAPLPAVPTSVRGLAADPRATRLYATADVVDPDGTPLGSVWRSDDGGEHWQPISGGDLTPRGAIAVDGAGDVYAVGGSTLFHYDAATGKAEQFATNFELPPGLLADPLRRGVLYTIRNALLYTSADGGHTWTLVASLNDGTKWMEIVSIAFDPNRLGVIYAAADNGLYRSLDGGTTWSALDALDTGNVAVAPSRSSTLYRAGRYGATLSRSDDGGATWTQLPLPASYAGNLTIDPLSERSLWIASDRSLYHSTDGGATWAFEGSLPRPIHGIVIDRNGARLHVRLDPDATPGEYDAVIRAERRRAARR